HHDIVGIVPGQPGVANRPDDAEPTENLHRARRDVIALHARRFVRAPLLEKHGPDAAAGEIQCEREAHRARPHDRDGRPGQWINSYVATRLPPLSSMTYSFSMFET